MTKMFEAHVFTVLPDMFPGPLSLSIVGNAMRRDIWSLNVIDIRSFADDIHRSVDDRPYGGGSGMLMRPDVLGRAIDHVHSGDMMLVNLTPRGRPFTQRIAENFIHSGKVGFICGRFEGIDARISQYYNTTDISMGDYIMTGGELAAMSIIDCCVRLIPGVLGNDESIVNESFSTCNQSGFLLECDQYTRPADWRGRVVPEVLRSGFHEAVSKWRHDNACSVTEKLRPDMWRDHVGLCNLSKEEKDG